MSAPRCPGQDQRYWKPEDIATRACPACGREIEIWKDEPTRACPGCGAIIRNPRLDLACAQWCPFGSDCISATKKAPEGAPPAPDTEPGKA
ncbi:MAG: hypothetical protein AAB215_08440 [Planctomycetota bacterium]